MARCCALWQRACDGDFARCFWPRDDVPCPKECDAAVSAATVNAMDGSIDIYDIYEDVCLEGKSRQPTAAFLLEQERRRAVERMRAVRGTLSSTPISPIFPTCADNYNSAYLNLPQVQEVTTRVLLARRRCAFGVPPWVCCTSRPVFPVGGRAARATPSAPGHPRRPLVHPRRQLERLRWRGLHVQLRECPARLPEVDLCWHTAVRPPSSPLCFCCARLSRVHC